MGKAVVVGITGASGAIYGIRLVEILEKTPGVDVHLVVSEWAEKTIEIETSYTLEQVLSMAHTTYGNRDLAAAVSSGSFPSEGMIIAPASMKTVAGIACGYSSNLIIRAADVMIKEQRKLIILPRETPLSAIHLENLLKLARLGVSVIPAIPGFYAQPKTIEDLVDHTVGKILDQFGIEHDLYRRWGGDG
jgi:4-hydroxy-3-polyprenylbenzoate decarboxylase